MARAPERRPFTHEERRICAALQAGQCPYCDGNLLDFKRRRDGADPGDVTTSGGCGAHGLWELFGEPPIGYRVTAHPATYE